ncbi:acetyl-CoA synthetase-like protein [Gigaspora margarita]|uniref:Acetyl-CoA synthetase-like protein n=1 Tax=Gigaspora margarita TaxID=4874 RepID=A0A8H4ABK1_GIGMA|nr:acetyl-CoA synthetase-like protein [Gigaspora margarita]
MVFKSNHPDIEIPQYGIFQYVMSNQEGISDNKIIYRDGNTSKGYTFGEFKSESKRFAAGLRDKVGFKRGDVLAIYSSNEVDYPMVLLGTIAAGGKVTPVDPKYVASELSYQLLDSGASTLIVHPDLLETAIAASKGINNPNFRIFLFGDNEIRGYKPFRSELIGEHEIEPIFYTPEEANSTIAYICYSSGTTGKQKGVEITHTNLVSNLAQIYNVEKDLGSHSVLAGVLATLLSHICVNLLHPFNFDLYYKIDYVHAAPPVILDLINYPTAKNYDLSSVKIIVSAGAPLGRELEYMFYELFKIRIKQAYGLSEALFVHYSDSNNIITGKVQLNNSFNNGNDNFLMILNAQKIGSCGTLLPNIKVKILSNNGHELGINEPGELCVHGPSIMKGYLNNSNAMNSAFDNDGFLLTGDIAYVDGQGFYFNS